MKDIIPIKRFTNPSGDNVWRLEWRTQNSDGSIQRNRGNYPTNEEAIEQRRKLEIAADNQSGPQFRLTRLDDLQLVDAEVALDLLVRGGTGQNLRFAVVYFNRTWRPVSTTRTLEAAVDEFLKEKVAAGSRPDSIPVLVRSRGEPTIESKPSKGRVRAHLAVIRLGIEAARENTLLMADWRASATTN